MAPSSYGMTLAGFIPKRLGRGRRAGWSGVSVSEGFPAFREGWRGGLSGMEGKRGGMAWLRCGPGPFGAETLRGGGGSMGVCWRLLRG